MCECNEHLKTLIIAGQWKRVIFQNVAEVRKDRELERVGCRPEGQRGTIRLLSCTARSNAVSRPLSAESDRDPDSKKEEQLQFVSYRIAQWTHTVRSSRLCPLRASLSLMEVDLG